MLYKSTEILCLCVHPVATWWLSDQRPPPRRWSHQRHRRSPQRPADSTRDPVQSYTPVGANRVVSQPVLESAASTHDLRTVNCDSIAALSAPCERTPSNTSGTNAIQHVRTVESTNHDNAMTHRPALRRVARFLLPGSRLVMRQQLHHSEAGKTVREAP